MSNSRYLRLLPPPNLKPQPGREANRPAEKSREPKHRGGGIFPIGASRVLWPLPIGTMPRYYCDYCDTYLTHDSPSVRKQHNAGYKHKANVRTYYQQFEEQQTQSLIDQRIKEHLGQTAAYQQVGAAFNQHLMMRPRPPVLPTPMMPGPGGAQMSFIPGMRPPVLPRPGAPPGYLNNPGMLQMVPPPGAPTFQGQVNGMQRPPSYYPTTTAPGSAPGASPSSGPPPMMPPQYQGNPGVPTSASHDSFNANNGPNSETNP